MKISNVKEDFSNDKIGNKVWAFTHGEGEITAINEDRIVIYFYNRVTTSFRLDGKINISDKFPTLLHSEPELIKINDNSINSKRKKT